MRFHHGLYEVHLPVSDVNRAIEFYVGKLGFELGYRIGDANALLTYTDGQARWMLGLFKVESAPQHKGPDWHHISFRVAEQDVDQMVSFLCERGIETVHPVGAPVQGPMKEPIVHGWMPAAAVFFKDPDGHLLELIADLSDAPRPDVLYEPLSDWRAHGGTRSTSDGIRDGNRG
jgi:catechol 2,3-dioxygenase-like lactoylglutathione lyase family enzyme